MSILKKEGFHKDNITSFGNMFLIGNGHIGYRGTLEEYDKNDMVGLNIVGIYDKYQDKWRESINMPNPFFIELVNYNIKNSNPLRHYQALNLKKAIHYRYTEYNDLIIKSERFITSQQIDTICLKYQVVVKNDLTVTVKVKLDGDIFEVNGPHFKNKDILVNNNIILFTGLTNENKKITEKIKYLFNYPYIIDNDTFILKINKDKPLIIKVIAHINHDAIFHSYEYYKKIHLDEWKNNYQKLDISLKGNKELKFNLEYSMYQVLILGNRYHETSIPARGLSGQTYKGAIFWDTEIFLLPIFALTDKEIAKKLIKYRINSLPGALAKAKSFNYAGAFYPWEGQEEGKEACSKYNVTDAITGKKLRTYFDEKQIHISIDIAYAILKYYEVTADIELLNETSIILEQIALFYISRSTLINGQYHLLDCIGPDEYHERIDDNSYTNYLVYYTLKDLVKYLPNLLNIKQIKDYIDKLYLPTINENKLIEQFSGYFNLEDTTVEILKKRLKVPNEYWGGENGVATKTKIIKQADVITLLVLLQDKFNIDILKANFDYYYPKTEHGSSLSSSMYGIIAGKLGYTDIIYDMFKKTSSIDLGTNQKMYAGTIYIGGTHPASNAGAYLMCVFGMAGLQFKDQKIILNPHLPKQIKEIKFTINYLNKRYKIVINSKNYQIIEE